MTRKFLMAAALAAVALTSSISVGAAEVRDGGGGFYSGGEYSSYYGRVGYSGYYGRGRYDGYYGRGGYGGYDGRGSGGYYDRGFYGYGYAPYGSYRGY
jgi:hypothetical protein